MEKPVEISFAQGTLLVGGPQESLAPVMEYLKFDPRVGLHRARACDYAGIVLGLHGKKIPFEDRAKDFAPAEFSPSPGFAPKRYQSDALNAWIRAGGRGMVVMPTGSGKSFLAMLAIWRVRRPALVLSPTIDLMRQWAARMEEFFGERVGMLGGGSRETLRLTSSTYDSAAIMMEFIGNRFGLVVFDECHHVPGPSNSLAASMCMAPYRMGLTATPERDDGGLEAMERLIGPVAYQIHIDELEGRDLAPYDTRREHVNLDPDEEAEYKASRKIYVDFLRSNMINFDSKGDWNKFIGLCARRPEGRKVLQAYLRQKQIARGGRGKIKKVWEILQRHAGERIIVFTAENETAYKIGEAFLAPVLTHKTKAAERKEFLDLFRSGERTVLVTSKVLNEGIDVPEASVGVVVSGSGSIREHVQRLGRILRAAKGKRAVLYEIIAFGTSEMSVSRRRREHRAYKRPHKI